MSVHIWTFTISNFVQTFIYRARDHERNSWISCIQKHQIIESAYLSQILVCERHFAPDSFRKTKARSFLDKEAYPTIFPNQHKQTEEDTRNEYNENIQSNNDIQSDENERYKCKE